MTNPTTPPVPTTIFGLPNAVTPLSGTEFTAIVQNGQTVKTLISTIPSQGGTPPVFVGGTSTGSANVQAITVTPANYAFINGNLVTFIAGFTNSGSLTLNANGTGAKTVQITTPSGLANLVGNEIVSGGEYILFVNGSVYQLINPSLGSIVYQNASNVALTGGTIDSVTIGGTTPAAGTFTTLTANGTVSLSPANAAVTIAPSGTGMVNINPSTVGNINNMTIGNSLPAAAAFTNITVTGATAPTNGIYRPSANTLGISAGGSDVVEVRSTGVSINIPGGFTGQVCALAVPATFGVSVGYICAATNASTATALICVNSSGAAAGSITFSTTATAYNTSSDKRKKINVEDYTNSGAVIDALEIKNFNFAHDPEKPKEHGVLAQDAYRVYPHAVTKGDDDISKKPGDEGFEDWFVDYSKFVPVLIAEIQSLRSRIKVMELK